MATVTVNQFHDNLRQYGDEIIASHEVLIISRRNVKNLSSLAMKIGLV